MLNDDDGHSPATCNYRRCGATDPKGPCPFAADEHPAVKIIENMPDLDEPGGPPLMANDMQIVEDPYLQIIADIVKNNTNLTPELQSVIAKYLDVQSIPRMVITPSKH